MQSSLSRNFGPVFIFVAGASAILLLNVPFANSWTKNAVYAVMEPVQRNVWMAGARVGGFMGQLSSLETRAAENERLRRQVDELLAKSAQLEELKKENEYLRQGLNLEMEKDFDLKLADVVGKDVGRDVLLIDKGSKDLIEAGMPVVTAERAVAGKISKVYENFSEVTLITAKDFSLDVKIGDGGIDGLVKGSGGFGAVIDLVAKDKELKTGDAVTTSSLGGIFPAGLLVGTVGQVDNNDVETFRSAAISLAFDINSASRVFVANTKSPLGTEMVPAATK